MIQPASRRIIFLIKISILFSYCVVAQKSESRRSKDYPSAADKYFINQYTVEQGLSDDHINDILTDSQGYLWIATYDGLNRFNGYEFTVFKHQSDEQNSISSNVINTLFLDKKGRLWIGTSKGLNLYDASTEAFQSFQSDPKNPESLSSNSVRSIYEDHLGVLWVGTAYGLNKFDEKTQSFKTYLHPSEYKASFETTVSQIVTCIGESTDKKLLVGYSSVGLFLFDRTTETFENIYTPKSYDISEIVQYISPAYEDGNRICMNSLFYKFAEGRLEHMDELTDFEKKLRGCHLFKKTASGMHIMGGHGALIAEPNFKQASFFIASEYINSINWVEAGHEDAAGDIWLGTRGQGLFHLNKQGSFFTNIAFESTLRDSAQYSYISSMLEVDQDAVWISERRGGITKYIPGSNSFEQFSPEINYPKGLRTKQISTLYRADNGDFWIGTWGRGLSRFQPTENRFDHFFRDFEASDKLLDNFVNDVKQINEKEIWVGTNRGLSVFFDEEAIQNNQFKNYMHSPGQAGSLRNKWVQCIQELSNGEVWLGTPNGLHLYDREKDNFIHFINAINDPKSLSSNAINVIFEDSKGGMWIGTNNGLNKFNRADKSFSRYTEKEGFPDSVIKGVQEDQRGRLWLITKTGISRFDPVTEQIKNYNTNDGLINFKFNSSAFIHSETTGYMYAGGEDGFVAFQPDSIFDNTYIPPIHITSLKKYDSSENNTRQIEVKGIHHGSSIEFSHQENIITFEATALNFQNTEKNQYAYQLEGFNDNWINIGTKREFTFTNLDAGSYTLRVKGSNNDGLWNEEGTFVNILIHPPWWKSNLAYLSYAALFMGLLFLIYRFLLRRQQLKLELQTEQNEALRLKELDSFKSRLYTNLTHEFRTPLTVIMGMADQVQFDPGKYLDEGLTLIKRNSKNLLRLINQLLDLSKLENKSFQLNLEQKDIVPYLQYLTESFHSLANGKNLSLRFFSDTEHLVIDYDVEQIKQIMTNLLSNAIKFTDPGGDVKVRLTQDGKLLNIEVIDNGIGISENDQDLIFDRFYQVDANMTRKGEGTGIGLSHTRELVKLMGGQIKVKSDFGKGSIFQIELPIRRSAPEPIEAQQESTFSEGDTSLDLPSALLSNKSKSSESVSSTDNSTLPQLLLIEDNPDVVIYLRSCLEDQYQIDIAYNGRIGIEKAMENIPDLIISDVMMPEQDGFTVCDTLKNNERTSHIPLILLTAKADVASRIAGLRRGADAYLSKPFEKEELLIRLEQLIERQKRMVAYFSSKTQDLKSSFNEEKDRSESIEIEDVFIKKIKSILEENIESEDFGLPQLCQKVGMSRSQLFRKMKALTGTAPSAFIKSYRLNKAKYLLENTDCNVAEAAYEVGFKDPSYFSKIFREEFGIAPSDANK